MTDTEILDWLIAHDAIQFGHEVGGDYDKVRTGGCGCCSKVVDTPDAVVRRIPHWTPENVECQTCHGSGCRLDGVVITKGCPDCTPENVEEPT